MSKEDRFLQSMERWFEIPPSREHLQHRASIGFDFIFYEDINKNRQISCIELNGHRSGIVGASKIPYDELDIPRRTLAKVRSHYRRYDQKDIKEGISLSNELDVLYKNDPNYNSEILKRKWARYIRLHEEIRLRPINSCSFRNDPALENVLSDKLAQTGLIPDYLRPKIVDNAWGVFSDSGYWLSKPINGCRGDGIKVIKCSGNPIFEGISVGDDKILQEFIFPLGAEKAPERLQGHPASMRYLIDYACYNNGRILPLYEFAYQRVSPLSEDEFWSGSVSFEDVFIVNKARGAESVPVSENELVLARDASREIIQIIHNNFPYIRGGYDDVINVAIKKGFQGFKD